MSGRRVRQQGWYCTACGAIHTQLPGGAVTCSRCGHLGLRGFEGRLSRLRCIDHPDWRGWDDGGVNDDLGRHRRESHARADPETGS